MTEFINVTALAVLQGVAEFLPISSSGHLVILQSVLDVPESLRMRLEVFLHAGTLISIFIFYRARIFQLVSGILRREKESLSYALKLLVSAIPAVIVYFTFKHQIEAMVSNVRMVGALLMFTGALLLGTRYLPKGKNDVGFLRALLMGIGQAFALLPGISRSGTTIAVARSAKVAPVKAAEFSFLMSAPLIMGGTLLEVIDLVKEGAGSALNGSNAGLSLHVCLWGVLLSAVVGYLSLSVLLKMLRGHKFWYFGVYCLVAGMCVLCIL